jgi:hypothetical protein
MRNPSRSLEGSATVEAPAEVLTGQLCVACGSAVTAEGSFPVETPALVEPRRVLRRHVVCPIPDWLAASLDAR